MIESKDLPPIGAVLKRIETYRRAASRFRSQREHLLNHPTILMNDGLRQRTWRVLIERALDFRRPLTIVETGVARDNLSTWLFSELAKIAGGHVHSVDIDEKLCDFVRGVIGQADMSNVTITCSDSVRFLKEFQRGIDILYLDSYDLDWLSPDPSMKHHLQELNAAIPRLVSDALIIIDDTPADVSFLPPRVSPEIRAQLSSGSDVPGKGRLCLDYLAQQPGVRKLIHEYQVVLQRGPTAIG